MRNKMSRPNPDSVENPASTPRRLYSRPAPRLYFGRRLWGDTISEEAAVFAQGALVGALLMGAADAALTLLIGGGR